MSKQWVPKDRVQQQKTAKLADNDCKAKKTKVAMLGDQEKYCIGLEQEKGTF